VTLQLLLNGELAFREELEAEAEEEAHSEEAEVEDPPNPVIPVANEMMWAALFFFILWALMKFVLLPPIQRGRTEREDAIRADKDAAERAQAELIAAQNEYTEELSKARAEGNSVLDEARAEADVYRQGLQNEADAEMNERRAQVADEIEQARNAALTGMHDDVSALAVEAASLVVEEPVDASTSQSVIDQALGSDS
jgi:F-type H+-transporting ATPase subunit b